MKNIILLAILIFVTKLSAQTESNNAVIYLYNKTKISMFEVVKVVSINDKEIATVKEKSLLIYNVLVPGTLKITIESGVLTRGTLSNTAKTSKNFLIEAGKEYHIITKLSQMGIKVKIANDKEIAKLKKAKYKETIKK